MRKASLLKGVGASLTVLLITVSAWGPRSWAGPQDKGKGPQSASAPTHPAAGLTTEETAAFAARFQSEIWPLLTRKESNCVGCHTASNPSQLHFKADAESAFKALQTSGHFDP